MANPRFIVVDDPGAVSFGRLLEARRLLDAELALVLEHDEPRALVRLGDLPPEADESDAVGPYLESVERLRWIPSEAQGERSESLLFDPEYAVVMHLRTPFVVAAPRRLLTMTDALEVFGSARLLAVGPDARLPGELPEIPPVRRVCQCPLGHQIENPPVPRICPRWDHLPLKC